MLLTESSHEIFTQILLACAVLGGAYTAFVRLTDRNTKIDTGLLHGRIGAVGLLSLAVLIFFGTEIRTQLLPVLVLLVLTMMAGVALYLMIRRKGELPAAVIFMHGLFAVSAFTVLVLTLVKF